MKFRFSLAQKTALILLLIAILIFLLFIPIARTDWFRSIFGFSFLWPSEATEEPLHASAHPDLAITSVSLTKMADPSPSFPYYKYSTNVVVKNLGADLPEALLLLNAGSNQKTVFIHNNRQYFSLPQLNSWS